MIAFRGPRSAIIPCGSQLGTQRDYLESHPTTAALIEGEAYGERESLTSGDRVASAVLREPVAVADLLP
jgi:hypothetical protein